MILASDWINYCVSSIWPILFEWQTLQPTTSINWVSENCRELCWRETTTHTHIPTLTRLLFDLCIDMALMEAYEMTKEMHFHYKTSSWNTLVISLYYRCPGNSKGGGGLIAIRVHKNNAIIKLMMSYAMVEIPSDSKAYHIILHIAIKFVSMVFDKRASTYPFDVLPIHRTHARTLSLSPFT